MTKTKQKQSNDTDIKHICRNRRAFHEYEIFDTLECGLVLIGSEVKSLRDRPASIEDAFARVKDGELWLIGCDIPEYAMANRLNHKPKRPRKLLLRKREFQSRSYAFDPGRRSLRSLCPGLCCFGPFRA